MLSIQPTSLRPGAASDTPQAANSGDPAGFASLLRQSRSRGEPAPAPDASAAHAAHDGTDAKAPAPQEPTREAAETPEVHTGGRAHALLRSKIRAADAPRATPPASAHAAPHSARAEAALAAEPAEPAKGDVPPAATPTDAPPLADPAVMQWLADQQRAPAALPPTAQRVPVGAAQGGAAAVPDATQDTPADPLGRALTPGVAVERDAVADSRAHARTTEPPAATPFAAVLAEQRGADKPLAARFTTSPGVAEAGATALAPAPERSSAPAPAIVIAAPVQTPDFAQELGLRLSVLARGGIHEAELHLNPADMGPVSVQIVMDGTQARIDFGADVAATRQAIEAGLPELASALRDAGFTLAGGGVSQHAGGRREGGNASDGGTPGERREVAAPELQRVATAARRLVRAGGVDEFA